MNGLSRPKRSPSDYDLVFRNLFSRGGHLGLYQTDALGKCGKEPGNCNSVGPGRLESCLGFVYPDDRERTCSSWKEAMEAGLEWSGEFRYCSADGKVRWLRSAIRQLRDGGGTLLGYIGCNTDLSERVRLHDELAERERNLRLALECAELGAWELDLESGTCRCGASLQRMLGRAPETEEAWRELLHPDDLGALRRARQQCLETGSGDLDLELRLKDASARWGWFRCRGTVASRDGSGRPLRLVGTLAGIGAAKRLSSLLDTVAAASGAGMLFVERGGAITFANAGAERILRVPREEIMRRGCRSPLWQLSTHEGMPLPEPELPLQGMFHGGSPLQDSFAVRRPDGERTLLSMNAAPVPAAEGVVAEGVVILEDVSELRQLEQELADHERLLRETQRIAQLGSYVLDLVDDRWSCSSKITEILGIDETFPLNLLGHFEIVHPDYRKEFIDSYLDAVMNFTHFEMEYKVKRHNDGVERWVAECCELSHDESGKLKRMIGTIQDITERKAAEEAIRSLNDELDRRVIERTSQLAEAKKEIESFSYSVSHDLRAPLRHINSYSSLLIEEHLASLPPEGRYYLERICNASSRMGKLIDDLLTLTRVGRAEMKRESFDISKVAIDVAEMLQEADRDCRATFIIERKLRAHGDSTLVRVVLENLIGNSLKYSSKNEAPRIEFGQSVVDNRTAFFVRDDGVGFDMAYAANLFKPFQRLHGAEFEGTGIGLATVQRIVERHGGRAWAEGKPGAGATFFFTLAGPGRS